MKKGKTTKLTHMLNKLYYLVVFMFGKTYTKICLKSHIGMRKNPFISVTCKMKITWAFKNYSDYRQWELIAATYLHVSLR